MLDDISGRGHQAVFRVFLEYPGKKGVSPEFLIRDGLRGHKYVDTNTRPLRPAEVETPDYEDLHLRRSLKSFIAALGKKYDGDPRIGFNTAGLLGTWGEWHTYPRDELFASKDVQREVMDAYEAASEVTPVLPRYPTRDKDDRTFGYYDRQCVEATHVTWLMDSGIFRKGQRPDRIRRAKEEVRRMGYECHALAVTIGEVKGGTLTVSLEVENRGVAPFYDDGKPECGLLAGGRAVRTFAGSGRSKGLLPGGKPVRFANATQDATLGWLVLGDIQLR